MGAGSFAAGPFSTSTTYRKWKQMGVISEQMGVKERVGLSILGIWPHIEFAVMIRSDDSRIRTAPMGRGCLQSFCSTIQTINSFIWLFHFVLKTAAKAIHLTYTMHLFPGSRCHWLPGAHTRTALPGWPGCIQEPRRAFQSTIQPGRLPIQAVAHAKLHLRPLKRALLM